MKKTALFKLLGEALNAANMDMRSGGGVYGRGLASEGYAGGYAQAINDVLLAMRDVPPSNSRYWPPYERQRRIALSRLHKVHYLEPTGLNQAHRTPCGRVGWPEANTSEASTANGDRFEFSTKASEVTCARCSITAANVAALR